VCPGHLLITGLVIAGRIVTPDLSLNATAAQPQLDATAYVDDIPREPSPSTRCPRNLTVDAGCGRIEVLHGRSPR